jgi:hypothetical protein
VISLRSKLKGAKSMSFAEAFLKLEKDHPERQPGSADAQAVLAVIKEQTADWEYKAATKKIPVFHFSLSIMIFIIGSLLAIGLSFLHPFSGLILETILLLLFITELDHPILAKLKPSEAENLLLTIPARSKETQRLIITTNFTTDDFTARPPQLENRIFMCLIYGLGFITFLLLACTVFFKLHLFLFMALLAILGIIILNLLAKENHHTAGLANSAILLELGSILLKARPSTTSVTLFFSGANSLNSGTLEIPKLLKGGPELNYVVNLVDWADKRINLITTDGLLLPQQSDPLLVEILMEVAKEKMIPIQAIKFSDISPVYSLKFNKQKAISVTNPLGLPESAKNLRELLSGLIRKLEH